MEEFIRSSLIIGEDYLNNLSTKKILIFGCGGVGSYVIETLARTNIKNFVLVDGDTVSISNINRQLIALHSTIGKSKVEIAKKRILDINPNANVSIINKFLLNSDINDELFSNIDYCIDCIDTVSTKIAIIEKAKQLNIPIISSMGTGNKLDPMRFKIVDISKTSVCPLAKVIRTELKKREIKHVDVLFSDEPPINISNNPLEIKLLKNEASSKHQIPGSIAFVPSIAGILIARHVILNLIK